MTPGEDRSYDEFMQDAASEGGILCEIKWLVLVSIVPRIAKWSSVGGNKDKVWAR
jgi:hypothetical protein